MDLLSRYHDSDSEPEVEEVQPAAVAPTAAAQTAADESTAKQQERPAMQMPRFVNAINAAPHVEIADMYTRALVAAQASNNSNQYSLSTLKSNGRNHLTGHIESVAVDNSSFDERYNSSYSTAARKNPTQPMSADIRAKRKITRDASDVDAFEGPWARREVEVDTGGVLTEAQKQYVAMQAAKKAKAAGTTVTTVDDDGNTTTTTTTTTTTKAAAGKADTLAAARDYISTTELHIPSLYDYQGRSYLSPPTDLRIPAAIDFSAAAGAAAAARNFIPKQQIHCYSGHQKAVNKILFLPRTGHLLLSASMDKTIKIWSVRSSSSSNSNSSSSSQRDCLRTIHGHTEGIRDVTFNHSGSLILSSSYDRHTKVFDTETGAATHNISSGKIPLCSVFNPNNEHELLVGQNDKKVLQYDLRAAAAERVVQTYNEHLGAVNTVTFMDNGSKFITTADDKKLFIWEYGVPVVIKQIAEPDMHSLPVIAVHPDGQHFCGQSQDNQILVFTTGSKPKLNRNKRFVGHMTAGYACSLSFSPDGQFVVSGDAQGRLFFWDWKTGKCYKKMERCHEQVTIGVAWHPIESSRVMTCSWDGLIKYWD